MTEKNIREKTLKLFLSLNISEFSLFFMSKLHPATCTLVNLEGGEGGAHNESGSFSKWPNLKDEINYHMESGICYYKN